MAQGAIARAVRNDPSKKSPGACLQTGPDGWAEPDPHRRAGRGGAERSQLAGGQVRGGLAMFPGANSAGPVCF
jgi:hypothetical protein